MTGTLTKLNLFECWGGGEGVSDVNVFVCNRGERKDLVKLQLELPKRVLERYKEMAKDGKYTPKQIMENMLTNWVDGVEAAL